jgi:16S rRNA (uracil1498-N3)-methyltransferase
VERGRRTNVARVVVPAPFAVGDIVTLDADTVHHLRVLRLDVGAHVGLTDGAGILGGGVLQRLGRGNAEVAVDTCRTMPQEPAVHMAVPVADRERMLWLAEKCTELAATSWRPVAWRRSASVTASGTGDSFRARVAARMTSALAQSGGAWLPTQYREASLGDAIAALPDGHRVLLDPGGEPLVRRGDGRPFDAPVTIMTGPEGGIEEAEREQLIASGFVRVCLAATILRFETAAVAGLAVVRAMLYTGCAKPGNDEPGGDGGD